MVLMSIRAGVLTVSDGVSNGTRGDTAGAAISEMLANAGITVEKRSAVPDEHTEIVARLCKWADQESLDVIVTTGGTGFSPRDVTPEATMSVLERLAPGFSELMRSEGQKKTPL